MTDFENAAFAVFVVLLSRAILHFNLNFYIPISKASSTEPPIQPQLTMFVRSMRICKGLSIAMQQLKSFFSLEKTYTPQIQVLLPVSPRLLDLIVHWINPLHRRRKNSQIISLRHLHQKWVLTMVPLIKNTKRWVWWKFWMAKWWIVYPDVHVADWDVGRQLSWPYSTGWGIHGYSGFRDVTPTEDKAVSGVHQASIWWLWYYFLIISSLLIDLQVDWSPLPLGSAILYGSILIINTILSFPRK